MKTSMASLQALQDRIGARTWSQNVATNAEYKILNGVEILSHPESIILCQSDASGTDGFGYAWSTLNEEGFN